jgi:hypothetical protein
MNHSAGPAHIIAFLFNRNGYVRTPNKIRLKKEDWQKYKKGYEVRFTIVNNDELNMIQGALKKLNIKYGAPFKKHYAMIQPVYGKGSYLRIMEMIEKIKSNGPSEIK